MYSGGCKGTRMVGMLAGLCLWVSTSPSNWTLWLPFLDANHFKASYISSQNLEGI